MAKNALFRNTFCGYNKNDVTRYIEELNVQYTDRGNELEGEIKQLKKELEALPALMAEKERALKLSEENEALKRENKDLSDAIKAQGEELDAKKEELLKAVSDKEAKELLILDLKENEVKLRSEKDKLSLEFESNSRQLKALSDEAELLKRNLEDEKADFERRAEEMLIQIQNQAKEVINRAHETADIIIGDARKKAEQQGSRVSSVSSLGSSRRRDNFADILDSHKSKMDSFFAGISKTLRGEGK